MSLYLRKPNFRQVQIIRKSGVLCLANLLYRFSEVITTTRYRKGEVILYKKYEALLEKTKKTSYQVSKDTGIAQSTLADWKAGKSNPKIDKLQTLSRYFDVPLSYFLEDTTEKC